MRKCLAVAHWRMRVRNSSRVFESFRKTPSIAEVTVLASTFWTPRIAMHM